MPSSLRKLLLLMMLCTGLGVITTVAVAWGLVVFGTFSAVPSDVGRIQIDGEDITIDVATTAYSEQINASIGWTFLLGDGSTFIPGDPPDLPDVVPPTWSQLHLRNWAARVVSEKRVQSLSGFTNYGDLTVIEAHGWPHLCLWCIPVIRTPSYREPPAGGFALPDRFRRGGKPDVVVQTLPLRPILPGFIINTLFYAAIWFVLLFGWRAHRRMIRKWQGYCPMCKYDLRGDLAGGCSECGWGRGDAVANDTGEEQ